MDALSDPRAFLSAQDKRAQQMQAMGIEESDINSMNIKPGNTTVGPTTKKSEGVRFQEEPKGENLSINIDNSPFLVGCHKVTIIRPREMY